MRLSALLRQAEISFLGSSHGAIKNRVGCSPTPHFVEPCRLDSAFFTNQAFEVHGVRREDLRGALAPVPSIGR